MPYDSHLPRENPFQSPSESSIQAPVAHFEPAQYAGFWIRLSAFAIDAVLLTSICYTIMLLARQALGIESPRTLSNMCAGAIGGYFGAFWTVCQGATPGKMIFKLRIVDSQTGGPLAKNQPMVRVLGYFLSFIICMLGFAWILVDRRKQGLHDKVAKTIVVRTTASTTIS